jgi:hypothetical protein
MLVTLPFVLLLLDYWPLGRLSLGQAGALLQQGPHPAGHRHVLRRGDIDASIRHFTEALRLKLDFPEARLSLTEAMHLKEGSR